MKYRMLHKVFCLALILYGFSSFQVCAAPLLKSGRCEAAQRGFENLEAYSVSRNSGEEFIADDLSGDMIWFSIVAGTSPPVIEVDVTELDFGETETSKTFGITNSGEETLVWTLHEDEEWITVDTTTGSLVATESTTVTVEVDRSKVLIIGEIDGTISISSNEGNAEIEVTMNVPEQPVLEVSPSSLDFGSEYVVKKLFISNSGTGILDWVIAAQEAWISVDHETGTTDGGETDVVNILVDRSAVTELGIYTDELSITSDGGDVTVRVVMERVNHPPEVPAVISPVDGATDQSLYTTFSWQGGDADTDDGDVVTYDVYFSPDESMVDAEDISVLTCVDMGINYCDPGTNSLESTTTYYWKVIAKDSYGEKTTGNVWSFITEDDTDNTLCPTFALELGYEERHLLRKLRDEVLAKDEDGRKYIKLYYRYSREILLILFMDNELRMKSMELCDELLPAIRSLLTHGETIVSAEMMEEIRELFGRIALRASHPLKAFLKSVEADIEKGKKLEPLGIIVSK